MTALPGFRDGWHPSVPDGDAMLCTEKERGAGSVSLSCVIIVAIRDGRDSFALAGA